MITTFLLTIALCGQSSEHQLTRQSRVALDLWDICPTIQGHYGGKQTTRSLLERQAWDRAFQSIARKHGVTYAQVATICATLDENDLVVSLGLRVKQGDNPPPLRKGIARAVLAQCTCGDLLTLTTAVRDPPNR